MLNPNAVPVSAAGSFALRWALLPAAVFLALGSAWRFLAHGLAGSFLPHQYCFGGDQKLIWANVLADGLIGFSYVLISSVLVWIVLRAGRAVPFARLFWLFGIFILSCAATHFLEVLTLWVPVYWLSTVVKFTTALASAGTAAVLIFFAPQIKELAMRHADISILRGNERFRALVESAPLAVVAADCDGKIISWNPAAEKIFGWKKSEVLGSTTKTVPPEKVAEQQALLARLLRGETIDDLLTLCLKKDGQTFPARVSSAPVYDEDHNLVGVMGTIEDISVRKRIETELQEKSETLTAVTQAMNTFLQTGDWSAASRQLLAFTLKRTQSPRGFLGVVLEGPTLRVLAQDGLVWDLQLDRELYACKPRRQAATDRSDRAQRDQLLSEIIYQAKTVVSNKPQFGLRSSGVPDGHTFFDTFLGVPIVQGAEIVGLIAVANRQPGYSGEEGSCLEQIGQATGVLYDNYRQSLKRAQLEIQRARLESEFRQSQKMELLGKLAGGVAHDFNNMLMILTGSAELLQAELPRNSAGTIYLDQIRKTADKATAITRQLLAFSRKQLLDIKPIPLHAVMQESEFMLPRLLGSDIELTFRHQAAQSWILADATQVEQVIANLAINARDAMPAGGKLAISTFNSRSLPIDPATSGASLPVKEWLVLQVKDTGCGMDEATRAHIFEPFFTTKEVGRGTGLGLSTVYGVVHQFGGYIFVDSRPGAGTSFELYFPVVEPPAPVSPGPVESAAPQKDRPLTILLADDETALRQAIGEFLRSAGHQVLDSHSSLDALELARRTDTRLDVLLTDVFMPGLRGTELARRVVELHPGIHVIFMSGYAAGFTEEPIPGDSSFLQKPFRFATLLEQLRLVPRKV